MKTFLNINLGQPIHLNFFFKHILFILVWGIGLLTIVFRFDLYLYDYLPKNLQWVIKAIPFSFFGILLLIMFLSKWYYNLALIFYPILIIFWFLPKLILAKGKIYLFSNYLSSIINTFKKFKRRILHFFVFIITLFLLFYYRLDLYKNIKYFDLFILLFSICI